MGHRRLLAGPRPIAVRHRLTAVRRWVRAAALVLVGLAACASEPGPPLDPNIEAGREAYGRLCSTCHGGSGEGGVGPALSGVVATFPDCATQLRWISLGSERWSNEVGPSYGEQEKEITGAMPSFEPTLTNEQVRQIAAFERSRYGGSAETAALTDCGL